MIEEIPYGKYIEEKKISETNDLDESLPVSIEIIPYTAIIVNEVHIQRRYQRENRECPNYVKWLIASSFCIPLVIILSSLRLTN